ncbi:unnamed protein product, partial [Rotaria sp. Silwood2]
MTRSIRVNTGTLPVNVFDLQREEFYNFVELHGGPIQAKILKVQLISNASTFIGCSDPTEILLYNSEKLNELKHIACLITNDGTYIVLAGVIASLKNWKKHLLKKLEEDMKKTNNVNMNSFPSSGTPIDNQVESTDQLRKHLNTIICQCYLNHRVEYNLINDITLEENMDYKTEFKNTSNGDQLAIITCGRGSILTLSRA